MPYSVFVGHRFTDDFIADFRSTINSVFEEFDDSLHLEYADMHHSGVHIFTDNIVTLIDKSLFCVFDITEERKPNVFIELGYAYGTSKYFVLTSRGKLPANLGGFLCIKYSSFENLKVKLSGLLPEIIVNAREKRRARRTRTLNTKAVLDDTKTGLLIELHRASLADRIVPLVEKTLMVIDKDLRKYRFNTLLRDISSAIDISRRLFSGFTSQTLGDMRKFFEKNFTEGQLKKILKDEIDPIIKSKLSRSAKRNKVYHQIDIEERKVFAHFHQILEDKSRKKRGAISRKLSNKSLKTTAR